MTQISETLKESAASLRFGLVEEVDETNYLLKVKLLDLDDMITHWLPLLAAQTQGDKSYDLPEVGTQVAMLLEPTGVDGVVLGAVYSEEDMPPVSDGKKWHKRFNDGTFFEYDKTSKVLKVDAQGEITVKASGPVTLEGPAITLKAEQIILDAPMTLTKSLTVAGKLIFVPI